MAEQQTALQPVDKFTNSIIALYGNSKTGLEVTDQQKDIIKGYFVMTNLALGKLGLAWSLVDMENLKERLYHYSRLGLDMQMANHLSPIPFNDNKTGKVKVNLIQGYEGYKYIAKKYGVTPPKELTVKLIGKNETFEEIYKDVNNECDNYVYKPNSFNKGEIIGGFAYLEYDDKTRNKLFVMPLADILKHKPDRANAFWEGKWKEAMYEKTLAIKACKSVQLDPQKIRGLEDSFKQIEADSVESFANFANAEAEENNGKGEFVDVEFEETTANVDTTTGEILEAVEIIDQVK